jgi:hypothetical protein
MLNKAILVPAALLLSAALDSAGIGNGNPAKKLKPSANRCNVAGTDPADEQCQSSRPEIRPPLGGNRLFVSGQERFDCLHDCWL